MAARINIFKDEMGDWQVLCLEHRESVLTRTWADAYEAAAGHACMAHPIIAATPGGEG